MSPQAQASPQRSGAANAEQYAQGMQQAPWLHAQASPVAPRPGGGAANPFDSNPRGAQQRPDWRPFPDDPNRRRSTPADINAGYGVPQQQAASPQQIPQAGAAARPAATPGADRAAVAADESSFLHRMFGASPQPAPQPPQSRPGLD